MTRSGAVTVVSAGTCPRLTIRSRKVSRRHTRWSQVRGGGGPVRILLCVSVLEELERNVIVEREEPRKEAGEGEGMFKLETIPKRLRHNTYS